MTQVESLFLPYTETESVAESLEKRRLLKQFLLDTRREHRQKIKLLSDRNSDM